MAHLEFPSDQTDIQMMVLYNNVHQRSILFFDVEQLEKKIKVNQGKWTKKVKMSWHSEKSTNCCYCFIDEDHTESYYI